VVVAGNTILNVNVAQFNFDFNKHVFNSSTEEFNKVSDKIYKFNRMMEEELKLRIKSNDGNITLNVIDSYINIIHAKII